MILLVCPLPMKNVELQRRVVCRSRCYKISLRYYKYPLVKIQAAPAPLISISCCGYDVLCTDSGNSARTSTGIELQNMDGWCFPCVLPWLMAPNKGVSLANTLHQYLWWAAGSWHTERRSCRRSPAVPCPAAPPWWEEPLPGPPESLLQGWPQAVSSASMRGCFLYWLCYRREAVEEELCFLTLDSESIYH